MSNHSRPHIFKKAGNGLFVHVPKSFTDEEIEHWANKEEPLGDAVWKIAPITAKNPFNRVDCDGNSDGMHVALTIEGKEFIMADNESLESDGRVSMLQSVSTALARVRDIASNLPRPKTPVVSCDLTKFGYEQLTDVNPPVGRALMAFMQELMRGEGEIPLWSREMILASVAAVDGGTWAFAVHRAAAIQLIGGDKDKLHKALMTDKEKALGAYAVALSQGLTLPKIVVDEVKKEGWSDKALHDITLIVGAAKLLNTYTEGLAASIPDSPVHAVVEAAGKKLVEEGYL